MRSLLLPSTDNFKTFPQACPLSGLPHPFLPIHRMCLHPASHPLSIFRFLALHSTFQTRLNPASPLIAPPITPNHRDETLTIGYNPASTALPRTCYFRLLHGVYE